MFRRRSKVLKKTITLVTPEGREYKISATYTPDNGLIMGIVSIKEPRAAK